MTTPLHHSTQLVTAWHPWPESPDTKTNEASEKHEKETNVFSPLARFPYTKLPLELRTRIALFHRQMEGGARNPEIAATIDRGFNDAHTRQYGDHHVVTNGLLPPEALHDQVLKGIAVLKNSELPNSWRFKHPTPSQEWLTAFKISEAQKLIIRNTLIESPSVADPQAVTSVTFALTYLVLVDVQPLTVTSLFRKCHFPNVRRLIIDKIRGDQDVPLDTRFPITVEKLSLNWLSSNQLTNLLLLVAVNVDIYEKFRLHTLVMTNHFDRIPEDENDGGDHFVNFREVESLHRGAWLLSANTWMHFLLTLHVSELRTLVLEYFGSQNYPDPLEPQISEMRLSKLAFFYKKENRRVLHLHRASYPFQILRASLDTLTQLSITIVFGQKFADVPSLLLQISKRIKKALQLHSIRLSLFMDRAKDEETTSGRIFSLSLFEELREPFHNLLETLRDRHWKHLVVPSCWLGSMASIWMEDGHLHTLDALVVEVLRWSTTSISDIQFAKIHTWLPNLRTFILRAQTPPLIVKESGSFKRMMRELEGHTKPHEVQTVQGEDGRRVYQVVVPPRWQVVKQFFDIPTWDGSGRSTNLPAELAVHPFFVRHPWFSETE
ncbi:hypothetical protein T439DRAFT_348680 [Meredithblackwellia eburnea MCA 4105]